MLLVTTGKASEVFFDAIRVTTYFQYAGCMRVWENNGSKLNCFSCLDAI